MTTDLEFQQQAEAYAKTALENIREMLDKLEHSRECDDSENCEHANDEEWHDEDGAERAIDEDPLSIEIRTDWHTVGAEDIDPGQYRILLTTGGPAAQIIGDLDGHHQPESARFQYQDWFKPWTEVILDSDDYATLLEYAQRFYFGE